jgi:hypothetical protein
MAETFNVQELVIPGAYVRVRAEGLIGAGAISTGNIGIVGTAGAGVGGTEILSDFATARERFGDPDGIAAATLNLTRALELLYLNGARAVFARGLPAGAGQDEFVDAFTELVKDDVNILLAPELPTATAVAVLGAVTEAAENAGRDTIAVIGSDAATAADIQAQAQDNDRIVLVAPAVRSYDAATKEVVPLPGTYSAAPVAGLLSTLSPQSSPTNKVLSGVLELAQRFSYGETVQLVQSRVLVLEQRQGVRVVRGLTTENGAFRQVTTRRIVDAAKAGVRQASNPFIGRLNNERVRKALAGAIDGVLSAMVQDEALTGYTLEVTATRRDEIEGRALVNIILQPTFSIDFVAVTMVLQ